MRNKLSSAIAMVALGASTAAASPVERAAEVRPDVHVEIENLAGSVAVTGWDKNEVKLVAELGTSVEDLVFDADREHVLIEVDTSDNRRRRWRELESRLEVWVPAGASVEVETVSAEIEIRGVNGALDVESVSGGVRIHGAPRRVDAETVSGAIQIDGGGTEVSVESVSGSIRVRGARGAVDLATVSGEIDVEGEAVTEADLESVSGRIRFDAGLARGAEIDAETHSGSVTLSLPADLAAEFDISTFSGNIDNELGPPARRTDRWGPGKELDFSTGDDASVSVETFSGNVALRKR